MSTTEPEPNIPTVTEERPRSFSRWSLEEKKEWTLRKISRLVKEGATPRDIAEEYPEIFIIHGDSIILLYETLSRKRWRGYD